MKEMQMFGTRRRLGLALVAATVLAAGGTWSTGAGVEAEVEAGVKAASGFVWRGRILGDEPCVQPSVMLHLDEVSFGVWANRDMSSQTNSSLRKRFDVTVEYARFTVRNAVRLGAKGYVYGGAWPQSPENTAEVYASYAFNTLLLPSLTVYYDVSEIESAYCVLGAAHSFELNERGMDLDITASIGAAQADYNRYLVNKLVSGSVEGDVGSGLTDASVSVSLRIPVDESRFAVTPELKYSTMLDSDMKDLVEAMGEDTDMIVYSVALTGRF